MYPKNLAAVMDNSIFLLDSNFCIHLESGQLVDIFKLFIKEFRLDVRLSDIVVDELKIKTFPLEINRLIHQQMITFIEKDEFRREYPPKNRGETQMRYIALKYMSQGKKVVAITSDIHACSMMSKSNISNTDFLGFMEIANERGLLGKQQAAEALDRIKKHGTFFSRDVLDRMS